MCIYISCYKNKITKVKCTLDKCVSSFVNIIAIVILQIILGKKNYCFATRETTALNVIVIINICFKKNQCLTFLWLQII